jgi:hypothetical protein
MTAKSLNLDLDLKEVDTTKGENKTPEFIKVILTTRTSKTHDFPDQPPTHRPHASRRRRFRPVGQPRDHDLLGLQVLQR